MTILGASLKDHKLFSFGDVREFRFSTKKVEYEKEKFTRGTFGDQSTWQRTVEQQGFENAAYKTSGQWTYGGAGLMESPVYVPWIIVDIDRSNPVDAHEDATTAVNDFAASGFDHMFVAMSGMKGFHVALSTSHLSCPIFIDSASAGPTIKNFVSRLTNVQCDVSTLFPHQVYRITGSRNLKSGLYKRAYNVDSFLSLSLDAIYKNSENHQPWYYQIENPIVEPDLIHELRQAANDVLRERAGIRKKEERSYNKIGPTIGKILSGIDESEQFGNHVGRNKAAFILSCFILEHPEQHRQVRHVLGLPDTFDDRDAFDTLSYWYDVKCEKGSHQVKLHEPFASAQRRVL